MSSCTNDPLSGQQIVAFPDVDDKSPSKPDEDRNENENNEDGDGDRDEDEEEDVDFNPFLKETLSPEASSSLSSEVEGLDGNSSNPTSEVQTYDVGDSKHGEEVVVLPPVTTLESEKQSQKPHYGKSKKRKLDPSSLLENEDAGDEENGSINPAINVDDEDAIWKRTRARYSLASFSLDELETFLQESDDEDDLPNVDDEQEYRKFLAAVLQGGDGDGQSTQENGIVDDEDEDTDADFEIELEELLESDVDVSTRDKDQKMQNERAGRRPETRQNRRQKASSQYKKLRLEQAKRPLRPILPILPNGAIASFPTTDGKAFTPETAPSYLSYTRKDGLINGFTSQQIGQLHCLIHEHVQLLIQVFSLCILDSSRQQIASQVQGLIFEMLHKRDEVMTCRSVPYPGICFHPSYMCPSVVDDLPNFRPAQCTVELSSMLNKQMQVSENISPSKGRHEHTFDKQISSSQITGSFWVPRISGPIVSILDVAPLNLVGRYMDDVYNAVQEHRQRCIDSGCDTWYEREPLFHLSHFPSVCGVNGEVIRGNNPPAANTVLSTQSQQPPKKTLAASIVESAKKQSIALVPRDISKLAQRFFPLFNPTLFPHKPPHAAVSNRVLFTDSEDELLALGMLEYNTDWKAIQQRFLPCKTEHQIFVRQKNRCSSKAPENPIKAVRRMKNSPLTKEEIECIQEGLKAFKLDWMSVWQFFVPHRDPSLLPRQWRIALGTQRSYKLDAAKKEKRRINESNRRRCKTADLANWRLASDKEDNQADCTCGENNSGDDCIDNANEAYIHQAFLSDWRPGASNIISSEHPFLNQRGKDIPSHSLPKVGTCSREQANDYGPGEAQPRADNMHGLPFATHYHQDHPRSQFTHVRHCPPNTMQTNYQVPDTTFYNSKSKIYLRPYRTRRNGARLVKLAPELPAVNLPPSVRVISESAFKSNQCGVSTKVSATGGGTGDAGKENIIPQLPHVANLSTTNSAKPKKGGSSQVTDTVTDSLPEESAVVHDTYIVEESSMDSDLQMHPLLFQTPEDGRLPYCPLNCGADASSSFRFFSGNQPQLNLSLFHNPHQVSHVVGCFNKSSKIKENTTASCKFVFHPLLQRTDEEHSALVAACSSAQQVVCLEGKSGQFQNHLDAVQIKSLVNSGPLATAPRPSSPNEKANELDLEIHLSSAFTKEISGGNRAVGANNQPMSTTSAPKSESRMDTCKANSPCCPCSDNGNPVLGSKAYVGPSNNESTGNMDVGDQSHPEIVMEQEELSDSDEEIEEHVEFECEEMADSDGEEGSGCEPLPEVHDKGVPSSAMGKSPTDVDYGDQQCELRSPLQPQCNNSIPRKGSPSFLKLGLTSVGKDTTISSWLSLDSCAPVEPPSMTKHEECNTTEGPAGKNLASCRPNRSCKKTTPSTKRVVTQKDVMDMAQQLSLGPLAVPTLRKPRKRGC